MTKNREEDHRKVTVMPQNDNIAPRGAEPQPNTLDIDEAIARLRRRLARLERERRRAALHTLRCLLANVPPPATEKQLVQTLDQQITAAQARLRELEAQRQQILLREIEREEDGNG